MSDVDEAAGHAERGFGGRVTGALGGVGRAGILAFGAVGAAAAVGTGFGVKYASDLQQTQVGFETMLGSGEKAKAFLGELQAFAAKTPFEFPDLAKSASRLTAVGVETSKVIPLMSALGDSTAAMGTGSEGIQRAVTALGQMQQKGKITGEEMMQLTEAGIPAWDALATKMGVSVPEAQAKVTAGQGKVNDLMEALGERAGPAMQKVNGMMEKQSQTLGGLFSTLKDTVGQSLGTIAQPMVEGLTKALPGLTTTIDSVLKTIGGPLAAFSGEILTTFVNLLPVIAPVLVQLGGVFTALLQAIMPAVTALLPMISQFATIIGGSLVQAINAMAPFLPPIATAFGEIMVALAPLVTLMGSVLYEIVKAITPIIKALAPVIATVATALIGALFAALEAVTPLLPVLAKVAIQLIQAIAPFLPQIISIASDLIGALLPAFIQILSALLPILPPLLTIVTALLPPFLGLIRLLIPVINVLADILAGVATVIAGALAGALRVIAGLFDSAKRAAGDLWEALEPVRRWIAGAFDRVGDAIEGMVRAVRSAWSWITKFIGAIPGWLRPGSPPPFAIGLGHVASSLHAMNRELQKADGLMSRLAPPDLSVLQSQGAAESMTLLRSGAGLSASAGTSGLASGNIRIEVPVVLDGAEVARVITSPVRDELMQIGRLNGGVIFPEVV